MKKVMFVILTAVLILGVTIPLPIAAQGEVQEELYLSDTAGTNDGETILFKVDLVDGTPNKAELTTMNIDDEDAGWSPGAIPLNSVASLACTPDGDRLYCIDWDNGSFGSPRSSGMGYVDLTVNPHTWNPVGPVTGIGDPPDIVQAAFSTEEELYVVSQRTESLYLVNTTTAAATLVGNIVNVATGVQLDVGGADLIFGAD
ncbi:hypothetical protein ACFLX4_03030, partial [Chloroflexota bacterium]